MSEVKHTPGPWDLGIISFVSKGGVSYPLKVDETRLDGESWLDMRHRVQPELDRREAEEKANCLLIAAAPELLEALEEARKHLEKACEITGLGFPSTMCVIDSAIAKAKGEA